MKSIRLSNLDSYQFTNIKPKANKAASGSLFSSSAFLFPSRKLDLRGKITHIGSRIALNFLVNSRLLAFFGGVIFLETDSSIDVYTKLG